MSQGLSRRRFLAGALGGGVSAAFLVMFGSSPAYAADPAAPGMIPARVRQSLRGAAETLGGALPLGEPLADLHKGWDGTVWGIDRAGVPYRYDPSANSWAVFGTGFDVIARWDATKYFVTRGSQISIGGGAPQALTDVWSNLPDSFAQGLDGAANAGGTIYLFRQGRYLAIDSAGRAGPPAPVTSLHDWPTSSGAAWANGAVDVVGSNGSTITDTRVLLWADGEYIWVDMASKGVIVDNHGPHPLSYYVAGAMQAGMSKGFNTLLWDENTYDVKAFNGPMMWHSTNRSGSATVSYATGYQATWVPVLAAAPAGSTGDLWAARTDGGIAHHDGTDWAGGPATSGKARRIAVGSDGTVIAATSSGLAQLTDGRTWTALTTGAVDADRLTVGDATHVFFRSGDGSVHRWQTSGLTTVKLSTAVTDIAAGSDGTLWYVIGDSSLYRYLVDGSTAATKLDPGLVGDGKIVRIGATGFDGAYLLTDEGTAQRYQTPFVFKTQRSYFPVPFPAGLAQAMSTSGHTLYLSLVGGVLVHGPNFVALDTQTGRERWSLTFSTATGTSPNDLGIHVLDPIRGWIYVVTDQGMVLALDAETGTLLWKVKLTTRGLVASATLAGDTLYLSQGQDHLLAVDVSDPAHGVIRWSAPLLGDDGYGVGRATVGPDGTVYVVTFPVSGPNCHIVAVNPADGTLRWDRPLDGADGSDYLYDIAFGSTRGADGPVPALFVNAGVAGIAVLDPATGTKLGSYQVPHADSDPPVPITSGLSQSGATLYFGDSLGRVHVLDTLTRSGKAIATGGSSNAGVIGQPAVIAGATPSAGEVVCVARGDEYLYFVDPGTGRIETVRTDQTQTAALCYDAAHGVLYAMSEDYKHPTLGQLFAVRPDSYVQDERAFIIESELMQDFRSDEEAGDSGVSRYQTHVTVVDAAKAPRANMSVKLWADEDGTTVTIDGQSFTIGTADPAYFTTDATGSFTIVSDATDLAATTLRLWAAFMDEHERIAIVPDAEFHQRLATTTATGSADPGGIDLISATDYDGNPLFVAGDADKAKQAAGTITTMTAAVGMGTPAVAAADDGADGGRYLAYPTAPGASYTSIDVASDRTLATDGSAGISLAQAGNPGFTVADAAAALDALTGSAVTLPGGVLSGLRHAWHEIVATGAKVVQVVVSVAKDVVAGIQYVANGVTKVVKAVVADIKDAAAAIGSFFVQLGKDIAKVVQALGKLLHLGEVLATARMISTQIKASISQIKTVMTGGQEIMDSWFTTAEKGIADDFAAMKKALNLPGSSTSAPIGQYQGVGQTPSTIYASGGPGTNGVQCQWATQTLRTQGGAATDGATVSATDTAGDIAAPLRAFTSKLASDPQLAAQFQGLGQGFGALFHATSADQFFASGLDTLLDIVSTTATLSLAVAQALFDAILAGVDGIVDAITSLGTVRIPILSALWHKLTGAELTYLDLICFVIAFPVTYLYRALEGAFPSAGSGLRGPSRALAAASDNTAVTKVMGLATAVATIGAGVLTAYIDGIVVMSMGFAPAPRPLLLIGAVLLLVSAAAAVDAAYNKYKALGTFKNPTTVLAVTAVSTVFMAMIPPDADLADAMYLCVFVIGVINLGAYFYKYQDFKEPVLTLVRECLGVCPPLLNPTKKLPYYANFIAPAADLLFRWASAGIQLAQIIEGWDKVGEPEPTTSVAPPPAQSNTPSRSSTSGGRTTSPAPTKAAGSGTGSAGAGTLANTGLDTPALVATGLGAIAVGGFAALTARRNRVAADGRHAPDDHQQ